MKRQLLQPRRALTAAMIALILAACGNPVSSVDQQGTAAATPSRVVEVGVFQIASAPVLDDIVDGFKESFLDETQLVPGSVDFVERNAQGDPSLIQSIARELADRDLDMIAVVGTPAVLAQAELETETPVVALAMGDPVGGGVAESLDAPGGNVTGSIDYIDPGRLLDEVLAAQGDVRRVGTVFDPANDNMRIWMQDLRSAVANRDIDLVEASITTSGDVVTAARSLGGRADAVLIGPDVTVISSIDAVASFARDERLGLYGVAVDAATPGVLASLGPDYHQAGRLAGEAAAEVYAGTAPGRVAFRRPGALDLSLNTTTAARLGLDLPQGFLDRVSLVAG